MAQEIVNSLLYLFNHLGQPKAGIENEIKSNYNDIKTALGELLPKGFEAKKQPGGPYQLNKNKQEANLDPSKKQLVQDYIWIRGEEKNIKDAPVSISFFLDKKDERPRFRVSVEIITSFGSKERKEKCFQARSAYESMLELPLTSGLSYFYSADTHKNYERKVVDDFIKNRKEKNHVEVVKLIDLSNSSDEEFLSNINAAIQEIFPFYKKATTNQSAIPVPIDSNAPSSAKKDSRQVRENKPKEISQSSLSFPKNVILFGPPGTGKTFNSIAYAEAIVENKQDILDKLLNGESVSNYKDLKVAFDKDLIERDRDGKCTSGHICFTTFHQSYSYEDFIEGIFPDVNQNGTLSYKLKAGVFKFLCDYAKGNPEENFVIIIDEINRGNISKIFGDLISLVEEGKRLGEKNALTATLPYSKEQWGVPSNVYIIGTMNTADRSIERIDTALRRRFHFLEIMPKPELLAKYQKVKKPDGTIEDLSLKELLTAMNDRIAYVFDREHQIGHSYFLDIHEDNGVYSLKELAHVFQREIIPLLQEYFYNSYPKIRYVLGLGDSNSDSDFITEKERSGYASYNFESIDEGDDEEKVYEINASAFEDVENYKKILGEDEPSEQ